MSNIIPKREKCVYTSCYCEENIWKLCEHVKHTHPEEIDCFYVVFISNKNKTIPIWMQRAADNPNDAVVWDYHVILVQKYTSSSFVYDLDTLLSFPCPFDEYVEKALGQENRFQKKYISIYAAPITPCMQHLVLYDGTVWQSIL
ncbi:protein N-terminal glutamine amidohydrolase-like [Lingula anatina]|uniref:Protein N-terminal glutamine amidohydrolase n=1 Tax=Lingula anatina TaxID=7574 RepID=A0A1S3JYG9_LINAN|nr:protein N-terminal glutamine amidohydrolase-like [Lingula anatina]|eukprot:XP_013415109.1 protein N-terminal glutamine amidohydrolase-like [Lingula anatina]